jgi:hypothetical protein
VDVTHNSFAPEKAWKDQLARVSRTGVRDTHEPQMDLLPSLPHKLHFLSGSAGFPVSISSRALHESSAQLQSTTPTTDLNLSLGHGTKKLIRVSFSTSFDKNQ